MKEQDKLKAILKERGYSGYRLAKEAGIHPQDLYCAMKGTKVFFPAWRARVCKVLNEDEATLFERKENNEG